MNLTQVDRRRVELPTSALRMCDDVVLSEADKALASTDSAACTAACTSDAENANADPTDADQGQQAEVVADPLTKLAAALLTLSPADRERLAGMLNRHQPRNGE